MRLVDARRGRFDNTLVPARKTCFSESHSTSIAGTAIASVLKQISVMATVAQHSQACSGHLVVAYYHSYISTYDASVERMFYTPLIGQLVKKRVD